MYYGAWKKILDEISSENQGNILDAIKEKLRVKYPDVYKEWENGESEKKRFNIDYSFQTLKCTLLHISAYYDKWNAIKFLLEKGANVNAINEDDETPLHLAAENNCTRAVKILLRNEDINVNIRDKSGKTPLHWAALLGYTDIVRAILTKKDVKVNVADKGGKTSLHWAVENDHIDIVKVLLGNGAKVDIVDRCGKTPLHWAALFGSVDGVRALLQKDANPLVQDGDGKIPRGLTRDNEIKQLLERAENRQILKLVTGVITGCITAVLGAIITIQLVKNETVDAEEMPIKPTVVIISLVALAIGGLMYKIYEPNTKIDEVRTVERDRTGISTV